MWVSAQQQQQTQVAVIRRRNQRGSAMFDGTVDFVATIRGTGLTFPSLDFNPQEPGVAKVVIEGALCQN